MNLADAVELLDAVSAFQFKASEKQPKVIIYDNQTEGFVLCLKANLVNDDYRDYIKGIANSRKLGIHEQEGYLIIYGY